jgi:hypothetical protein
MAQKIVGLGFLLLGIAICLMDPVIALKCTRSEDPEATCALAVKAFGVIPLSGMEWQGVTGVTLSSNPWGEPASSARVVDVEQLILRTKSGEVRPRWLGRRSGGSTPGYVIVDLPPFNSFVTDMNNLIEYGKRGEAAEYKAITWLPVCVGLGFMLFGVLALWPFIFSGKRSILPYKPLRRTKRETGAVILRFKW